jgi:ABC-type sugar transport system substrate-binding protein
VDTLSTDYTTADGLAKTRTILQSHPEVDTILSIYSDLTQGVIQALTQAGKLGKINVIDIGASTYSVGQVSQGHELFTVPYTPVDAALGAFKTLLAAFQTGVTPNRTIDVFPPSNGTVDKPLIIDKSNAATYQPQF